MAGKRRRQGGRGEGGEMEGGERKERQEGVHMLFMGAMYSV